MSARRLRRTFSQPLATSCGTHSSAPICRGCRISNSRAGARSSLKRRISPKIFPLLAANNDSNNMNTTMHSKPAVQGPKGNAAVPAASVGGVPPPDTETQLPGSAGVLVCEFRRHPGARSPRRKLTWTTCLPALLALTATLLLAAGCGGAKPQAQNNQFFTSGSREADQRASQRMAKAEQLSGNGEGPGEKGVKKAKVEESPNGSETNGTNEAARAKGKLSLYER